MTVRITHKTPYLMVYWQALDTLDLSLAEYALLDVIHGFSLKTGWCYASRAELAARVRMKPRWVFKQLAVFAQKGLIETDPQTRQLRPTAKWLQLVAASRIGLPSIIGEPSTVTDGASDGTCALKADLSGADSYAQNTEEYASDSQDYAPDAILTPTDAMHTIHTISAQVAASAMHMVQPTYAPDADNNNKYSNTKTIQKQNNEKNSASARKVILSDFQLSEKNGKGTTEVSTPDWEPSVVNPPPVAPVPSLAKESKSDKVLTDSCLIACRQVYLRAFPAYSWHYGRDDKFLKGVLDQIRVKIARQTGETDASDEYMTHSFESFLAKVPDWYRRNGHTTPADLNRHFEKHYAAIKAGQGGGSSSHLAPTTDRDREYLELMQRLAEG